MERVVYYEDELKDDFAGVSRNKKNIPDDYCYNHHNVLFQIAEFVAFRIIMTPIAYLYCKCKFGVKIENKEKLRECKKKGFFLYGNHTQVPGDGYLAALVPFPKKIGVLVHPDSVAVRGTENFMQMLGAMPLPSSMRGLKNLENAMEERLYRKQCIVIFPEAHIWPYYTGIRAFTPVSFRYPVKWQKPVYCFTTTYRKRAHSDNPKMVVYVDGPFYPDEKLHPKKQQELLRNQVYYRMLERAKESDCSYITYIKRDIAVASGTNKDGVDGNESDVLRK